MNFPSWSELVGGRVLVQSIEPKQPHAIEIYVLEVSPSGKKINAYMSIVGKASWIDASTIELIEILPLSSPLKENLRSWEILTLMRNYDRNVTITFMNDEEGLGAYVLIDAPWTQENEVEYYGETLLMALELAMTDMKAYVEEYGK